jgi:hypothetical protein
MTNWRNTELTPEAKNLIRNLYRSNMPICDIIKKLKFECDTDVDLLDVDQNYLSQDVARAIVRGGEELKSGNASLLKWLCDVRPMD